MLSANNSMLQQVSESFMSISQVALSTGPSAGMCSELLFITLLDPAPEEAEQLP
jgi:hypothetical protein